MKRYVNGKNFLFTKYGVEEKPVLMQICQHLKNN